MLRDCRDDDRCTINTGDMSVANQQFVCEPGEEARVKESSSIFHLSGLITWWYVTVFAYEWPDLMASNLQ